MNMQFRRENRLFPGCFRLFPGKNLMKRLFQQMEALANTVLLFYFTAKTTVSILKFEQLVKFVKNSLCRKIRQKKDTDKIIRANKIHYKRGSITIPIITNNCFTGVTGRLNHDDD
ncbi:hypothetical protein BFN05_18725 [Bacillus licheniformis]|nr:hypothetical protein BFN05_18725 [Bacillus licheniformis]